MDIQVENHGSIYLLRAITSAGAEWLEDKIAPDALRWPRWPSDAGDAIVVEPRYVAAIVDGAINDGLEVR